MRGEVLAIVLVAGTLRAARADPPEYPVIVVDRPLVLLPGMTVLDISLDLPTYVSTSTDAMGNTTMSRTRLGHYRDLDLNVSHAFGPIEINAGFPSQRYDAAHVGASMAVTEDSSVGMSLSYYDNGTVDTTERDFGQSAGYAYRVFRMPSLFAAFASVGIDLTEIKLTPPMEPPSSGHYIAPYGSLGGELQLTPNVVLAERVGLEVPVSTSHANSATSLGELTTAMVSFGHWDLYAQFAMNNLIHTPHPFSAVGFTHRWN